MKKFKILIILAVCFSFAGCKEYGEKRIVNFVTVDSDKIAIYYDDFSKEKEGYIVAEKENKGISNTLVQLLSEADYDLKLCRYAVVSKDILSDNINELYFALTDSRFAPDIIILEGETNLSPEEYEKADKTAYPLYNYKTESKGISCAVERLKDNGKYIIIDSEIYKQLGEQQSFVFDLLNQRIKRAIYFWEDGNKTLSAELENLNRYYYVKNNDLYINVTAVMKSYKGAPSNENDKKTVENLLETNISKNIEELLKDERLTEIFDLLWYNKVKDFNKIEVNTNIV